uniref:CRIB domain-containing protein n=1 Tax=Capitella teleta TaxID=283909 RepID=X1YYV5_CAPTE
MSEVMLCFTCCVTQQPTTRRRRIDRSMIGGPTDFRHTGHIGSADVHNESTGSDELNSMHNQMQSKGGYDHASPVHVSLNVVDVCKS